MSVSDKEIRVAKNDGVTAWGTIVTLEESARRAGVIWTGTDDGVVSVTRDAGKAWANVTANFSGVPKWTYVADVVPSQHADGTAYVAFDGHRGGDYGTYAFVTTDFGATTRSIAGNLPKGEVVRTILEDPKNADLLYLGTETGLWISAQPRRSVDAAEGQPADDADLRDEGPPARQRPDRGHARPRTVDSRRPRHHPAVGQGRGGRRVRVRARAGDGVQRRQRQDEGLRGRPAVPGAESGARGHAGLPAEGRRQGRELGDPGGQPAGARDLGR